MTRILIIEDSPDLAFAVSAALEAEGYEVATAESGPSGLETLATFRPALVVLDVALPGFDGFRVLRILRDSGDGTPVLILTARGGEDDKLRGFRLGADDYLTKPFGVMELVARVAAVLRRSTGVAPHRPADVPNAEPTIRFDDVEIDFAGQMVRRGGQSVSLTPKEYELLTALVRRRGTVVRRSDLIRDVWGYQADVSTRTLDVHMSELRRKLERNPAEPRYLTTVWKVGYRFDP